MSGFQSEEVTEVLVRLRNMFINEGAVLLYGFEGEPAHSVLCNQAIIMYDKERLKWKISPNRSSPHCVYYDRVDKAEAKFIDLVGKKV